MAINPDSIPFLQIGQTWPPEDHIARLQRYEQNRNLFVGEHHRVYDKWPRLLRDDYRATLEIAVNFPGAVSKLFADLLFGEMPAFIAAGDDDEWQAWVDEFVATNKIHQLNYKAALAQSYRGDAIFKLRLIEGRERAVVEVIPASIWFPVVNPDNVSEIEAHVLAWTKEVERGTRKDKYLRAEIHAPGLISHRLYALDNDKIDRRVALDELYENPPPDDEQTGVDRPLLIHVPNLELDDTVFGQDDYFEADTLFQELDVRLAQIAKVLDKHSDPNMYGPPLMEEDPETGELAVKAGGRYFPVQHGDVTPAYLVWDAQMEANFRYLDRILQSLYIVTDTNAAAFSLAESGSFPSGAALKRLLMRPLARTNRKRLYFDAALKELFSIAAELERANKRNAPEGLIVEIEWKDGLPDDPMEQAQIEQIRTGGKATSSVRSAIRRLDGGTNESIDNELSLIAEDEAMEAAPGVSLASAPFAFGEIGEMGEE